MFNFIEEYKMRRNVSALISIFITLIVFFSAIYVLTTYGSDGGVRSRERAKVSGAIDLITPDDDNPEEGETVVEGETFVVTASTRFRGPVKSFSVLSVGQEVTAKGRRRTDGKVKARLIRTYDNGDDSDKPAELMHPDLYSEECPFNQKIPPDAEVDPKSSTPASVLKNVPIPDFATPDPSADSSLVIIDLTTGCEYDFWKAQKDEDGIWTAGWANAIPIDSDGVYPKGLSARGSGFALLAGVMWPDELENGEINHALGFSYSYPKAGGPYSPLQKATVCQKRMTQYLKAHGFN